MDPVLEKKSIHWPKTNLFPLAAGPSLASLHHHQKVDGYFCRPVLLPALSAMSFRLKKNSGSAGVNGHRSESVGYIFKRGFHPLS